MLAHRHTPDLPRSTEVLSCRVHHRPGEIVAAVSIENRAQLVYLLTEAAELEHNVLCSYLFADFSMKQDATESLTADQLTVVVGWRSTIRLIAQQEMLHLASACNLLTAVGGAPQLRRPNLPTSPRAYPSAFQLRFVPFGMEAVEQFIFLERPASLEPEPGARAPGALPSFGNLTDIFSSERDYKTLGQLYRGIEDGLKYLTQKYGQEGLFVGRRAAQSDARYFGMPGLTAVHDLDSALEAVNIIIEQGEGASLDEENSHYKRFLRIRDEYRELLAADPGFVPGRPVLTNPYAVLPSDLAAASDVSLVDSGLSRDACNLFDGCYELMVQVLGRLFVHAEEGEDELKALADTAVELMLDVIEPLGCAITLLPAGPSHPGLNAGPGFRLSRGASIPTHGEAARFVFHERLSELSAYCRFLQSQAGAPQALKPVGDALMRFSATLVKVGVKPTR